MVDYESKIKEFEEELKNTDYNKRTQFHVGLVKAKIARLRESQEVRESAKKKGEGYSVRRTGDATAAIIGCPSVGKSTLLNKISNAESKVGDYDFTTLTAISGMLEYKNAKIQVIDVPGIIKGAARGSGRGREVLAAIRSANLILIIVDVNYPNQGKMLEKELFDAGLRLNKKKPDIKIRKMARGGIRIGCTVKLTKIDEKTITDILKEFRLNNAEVLIRSDITDDELIDAIEGNRIYIPSIVLLNKIDAVPPAKLENVMAAVNPDLAISAEKSVNIERLKEMIFEKLSFVRIFLKEPRKDADMEKPMIMFKGVAIIDLCRKLHADFADKFKFARVWRKNSKFSGQRILNKNYELEDGDVVEVHLR